MSRVFLLYEIEDGNYRITVEPDDTRVSEYLKVQGRFRHLDESDIEVIQANVDGEWDRIKCLST